MIVPLAVAAIGIQAIGAFKGFKSGKKAAKAQRRLAEMNARNTELENKEQVENCD